MKIIKTRVTTDPDLSGWHFYVKHGDSFDPAVYEEHSGVRLSHQTIKFIQVQSAALNSGEWLEVYEKEVESV